MELNYESKEKFEKNYGDVMSLDEFIECCKEGTFIDSDGVVGELLHKGKVIYKKYLLPSDVLREQDTLKGLNETKGSIEVVWYNR